MGDRASVRFATAIGLATILGGRAARAAGSPTAPPPAATVTTTVVSGNPTTPPTVAVSATQDLDGPDHARVVGHLGLTYFGVNNFDYGALAAGAAGAVVPSTQDLSAPTVGVRYWLNRHMGIDAGLGFGFAAGSTNVDTGGLGNPSVFGLLFHGGVPLALAQGKHYVFEIIPEANVGFLTGSQSYTGNPSASISGFRLDLGARAGAEIHFGFIGIPELALQATVGLMYTHIGYKVSQGGGSFSTTSDTIGTTVQDSPWAILTNNLAAIYYF